MTTENPDAEVVREALHYGRRQHDLLMNDGPNRGHQCAGCNKFIYARESFSRLEAQAALVEELQATQRRDRLMIEAIAADRRAAKSALAAIGELTKYRRSRLEGQVDAIVCDVLSSIPSQEERA